MKELLQPSMWRIEAKKYIELIAGYKDGKIEAVGISWENAFHPYAKYIRIVSHQPQPELLKALIQEKKSFEHVIYNCDSTEVEVISLLEEAEFKLFRKTYEERYAVEKLMMSLTGSTDSLETNSLAEVQQSPKLEKQLFSFVKYYYEKFHLDNPVREESWEGWREIVLTDEVVIDAELSRVAVHNGEVVGYIFVHPTSKTNVELGYMGKIKGISLFTLLKIVLQHLHDAGYKTVDVEIDTTDLITYELAELLELDTKESWNSYKL